jgi:hypothetical protein
VSQPQSINQSIDQSNAGASASGDCKAIIGEILLSQFSVANSIDQLIDETTD